MRRRGARGRVKPVRGVRWVDGAWRAPRVRAAAGSGVLLAVTAALALSPLFRVRQVTWTGLLQADPARCDEGRLPWDHFGADIWEVIRG